MAHVQVLTWLFIPYYKTWPIHGRSIRGTTLHPTCTKPHQMAYTTRDHNTEWNKMNIPFPQFNTTTVHYTPTPHHSITNYYMRTQMLTC
jgi:hypothetical protein